MFQFRYMFYLICFKLKHVPVLNMTFLFETLKHVLNFFSKSGTSDVLPVKHVTSFYSVHISMVARYS